MAAESIPPASGTDGPLKCARCGVESLERTCFIVPGAYSKPPRDIRCITCEQRRLKPTTRQGILGLMFVTLWPAFILGPSTTKAHGWYFVCLLCGCLLYPFIVIAHELGHAFTAWLLRMEIGAVGIGFGAVIARFELASVPVQIHAWPLSGRVYPGSRSLRLLRTRLWITTFMGPATNALLVAATVHWWDALEAQFGPSVPALCLAVNLMVVIFNLVPHYARDLGQVQRSDGLALIQIPFTPDAKLKAYLYSAPLMHAQARFEAGDFAGAKRCLTRALARLPGNAWLTVMYSGCCSYVGDYTEARLSIATVVEQASEVPPIIRAAARNNLAFALLMENPNAGAQGESLKHAERLSREAFEMYPCLLAFRSTLALILAAVGRSDEALWLLDYVHYTTASARERSEWEAARGFALLRSGRADEAREARNRAVSLDSAGRNFLPRLGLSEA
jgi:Flp pilus assembly protein TadD